MIHCIINVALRTNTDLCCFPLLERYMATSGGDRKIKIWDLRTYRELYCYKVGAGPGQLAFSQTGLLGAGMGNIVEVKRT